MTVERIVHLILQARGKRKTDAPAAEWFVTTLGEVQEIIRFLKVEITVA